MTSNQLESTELEYLKDFVRVSTVQEFAVAVSTISAHAGWPDLL